MPRLASDSCHLTGFSRNRSLPRGPLRSRAPGFFRESRRRLHQLVRSALVWVNTLARSQDLRRLNPAAPAEYRDWSGCRSWSKGLDLPECYPGRGPGKDGHAEGRRGRTNFNGSCDFRSGPDWRRCHHLRELRGLPRCSQWNDRAARSHRCFRDNARVRTSGSRSLSRATT